MSILLRRHNLWDDGGGIPTKGLLAEWLLDERVGTGTASYATYTPDSLNNFPLYLSYNNSNIEFYSGGINSSSNYMSASGGAASKVTDANFLSNITNAKDWSLSFWWKCPQTGLESVSQYVYNSGTSYHQSGTLNMSIGITTTSGNNTTFIIQNTSTANDAWFRFRKGWSDWGHFVVMHNGSTHMYDFYYNASKIEPYQQTGASEEWTNTNAAINMRAIGFTPSSTQRAVRVAFDNYRVYKRLLTEDEILALYNEKNM